MSMEKGRKRKKPDEGMTLPSAGWKKVDVGDELLLGSEEGGFLGLEELSPAAIPALSAAVDGKDSREAGASPFPVKPKMQKIKTKDSPESEQAPKAVKPKRKAKTGVREKQEVGDDVGELKAKLAALQQENAALKYAPELLLAICMAPAGCSHCANVLQACSITSQLLHGSKAAAASCRAGSTPQPQKEKHIPADPNSARSRKLAAKKACTISLLVLV